MEPHRSQRPCIPAGIGVLLILFGALATTENAKKRMLWMHIAVTLGLIGLSHHRHSSPGSRSSKGTAMSINPMGFEERAVIAFICFIYVLLCVRSFIAARRGRLAPPKRKLEFHGKSRSIQHGRHTPHARGRCALTRGRPRRAADLTPSAPKPKFKDIWPEIWALIRPRRFLLARLLLPDDRQPHQRPGAPGSLSP